MVLWGSAAVYGLPLPEPIYFYDMSESSSPCNSQAKKSNHRPPFSHSVARAFMTPVINLENGTAAVVSLVRTNEDIIALSSFLFSGTTNARFASPPDLPQIQTISNT